VQSGKFRKDLFYRIRVIHIQLPDLKDRREDIPLLVSHLVSKLNRLKGRDIAGVSGWVMARLMEYEYPGNIRELENIIEHAFALCEGELIDREHLPPEHRPEAVSIMQGPDTAASLKAMEKALIKEVLRRHGGSRIRAARELGIDTSTLYRKIKAMEIALPPRDGRSRKE